MWLLALYREKGAALNEALRRWVENPENIARIAKVALEFLELIAKKLTERESKLSLLLQKSDQSILREIRAAFQALCDATVTQNPGTKERLLTLAETNLYNNTELDKSLKTGGYPNSYWMAEAHYGLAIIYALRRDDKMVARHLLRIFLVDPRQGRKELVPELYEEMFKPNCAAIFSWYEEQKERIDKTDYTGRVIARKLLAGGVGVGGVAGALALSVFARNMQGGVVAMAKGATESAKEIWEDATPEAFQVEATEALDSEMEQRLDERCRELALEALSLSGSVGRNQEVEAMAQAS